MKQLLSLLCTVLFFIPIHAQVAVEYGLNFSTFFGGNHFEQARDLVIDQEGNIYLTGGTSSANFPTTPGAYNTVYNDTGSATVGNWGPMMVFVAKFSPEGELLWSTFLGGPNYDRAYAIEVDEEGFVYVGGRAGDDFPTTEGVFQEEFVQGGGINNLYGHQNGFIAKLSPDGSELIWSTYYGADSFGFFRDFDIDDDGYVYGILNAVRAVPAGISDDAFDTDLNGSYDMVAVKFNPEASDVEWATFLGGSGEDRGGPAIRVGTDKSVFVGGSTKSNDFPTTTNAIQSQRNGPSDFFVTRITADGTALIYSTYFGGNGDEFSETHSLYVDHLDQAYVACATRSTDISTTLNAFKPQKTSTTDIDGLFFKLSTDGSQLLACTYFGGPNGDEPEGLHVDEEENLYVGGGSASDNLPVSSDAPQSQKAGGRDGFIVKMNTDFSAALVGSYFGGTEDESVRAFGVMEDGSIAIAGQTSSEDFPVTLNAFQTTHASSPAQADSYLAFFEATPVTATEELQDAFAQVQLFPNPATDYVQITSGDYELQRVSIMDITGRILLQKDNGRDLSTLTIRSLPTGQYVLKISLAQGASIFRKLVVK